jgi:hypothetical protein
MEEANESYHPQIVQVTIAMALFEARKVAKRTIRGEGRVKLCRVPARDIEAMAREMVEANPAEYLAKAKA